MGATMQGGPGPAVMCSSSKFGEFLGYRIFTSEMATRTADQNPIRSALQRFDFIPSAMLLSIAGSKMISHPKVIGKMNTGFRFLKWHICRLP